MKLIGKLVLAMMLVLAVSFVGCKGSDETEPETPKIEIKPDQTEVVWVTSDTTSNFLTGEIVANEGFLAKVVTTYQFAGVGDFISETNFNGDWRNYFYAYGYKNLNVSGHDYTMNIPNMKRIIIKGVTTNGDEVEKQFNVTVKP